MERRLVQVLHPKDNVATALTDLAPGTFVALGAPHGGAPAAAGTPGVEVRTPIPFGHKIALQAIAAGQPVTKYGEAIGLATVDIVPGEHVHTHNVESQRGRGDLAALPT